MPLTLIQGGEVYAPRPSGRQDVLLCLGRILKIGNIDGRALTAAGLEVETVDATGCIVTPGFIDPHEHLLGGSGEDGFSTQTPEISASEIVSAGITTVVGCLGVDTTMKTMPGLLAKAKALKEEGLNAYVWSGGYRTPPATINNSISTDIMFVDEIIGVGEIAIADDRSTEPTPQELARIVSETHNSGMLSQKSGLTHFHVGDKPNRLELLREIIDNFNISAEWLYPTHIGRSDDLLREAIELAKRGCFVDLDTVDEDLPENLKMYLDNLGWEEKLTVSSDASVTGPQNLYSQIARCIVEYKYPIEQMIRFVTANTADALKLKDKGRLREGNVADVLVIKADSFELQDVFCNGKRLFKNGQLNFRERFLKDSNRHVKLDGEKPAAGSNGKPSSDPDENKGKFHHSIEQVNAGNGSIQGIININGGQNAGRGHGQNKYLECNTPVDAPKENNKPDDRDK